MSFARPSSGSPNCRKLRLEPPHAPLRANKPCGPQPVRGSPCLDGTSGAKKRRTRRGILPKHGPATAKNLPAPLPPRRLTAETSILHTALPLGDLFGLAIFVEGKFEFVAAFTDVHGRLIALDGKVERGAAVGWDFELQKQDVVFFDAP